jgi:signal transduction histidine kinase
MLDRSRKRLKALADLVDDLLNVTRMEAESVRREIVPRSVSEVLAEVVALLQPLADPGGIAIRLESEDGLPPVPADREELIRLFTNLVSNAVKYNRPGGSVTLRADRDGAYVRVSVADTGIGIGEEGLERLFSEFYREKRPETRHVTGTGLGLNLVKRIVDFYHGRVEVRSRPGEGSVFTVWLPSAEAPPLDGARSADAGNP